MSKEPKIKNDPDNYLTVGKVQAKIAEERKAMIPTPTAAAGAVPVAWGCFDGDYLFATYTNRKSAEEMDGEHEGCHVRPLFSTPPAAPVTVTETMVDAAIRANTEAKLFGGEPRDWVRAALSAALSASPSPVDSRDELTERLRDALSLVRADVQERTKAGMTWGIYGHPTISPATLHAVSAALSLPEHAEDRSNA